MVQLSDNLWKRNAVAAQDYCQLPQNERIRRHFGMGEYICYT